MTATVNAITRYPDGTIHPYSRVEIGIYGYGLGADGSVVAGVFPKLSGSDGSISFSLPANNTGEFYSWNSDDGSQVAFGPVPASGSFTLAQLEAIPVPTYGAGITKDQLTAALTAAIAAAGYTGAPLLDPSTTRPVGVPIVGWVCASVSTVPPNMIAGDLVIRPTS